MTFLQFLYDISDRRVEEEVAFSLIYRYFVGLDPSEKPPDHTTFCRFRKRLGPKRFEALFNGYRIAGHLKGLDGSLSYVFKLVISTCHRRKGVQIPVIPKPAQCFARIHQGPRLKGLFNYLVQSLFDFFNNLIIEGLTSVGRSN